MTFTEGNYWEFWALDEYKYLRNSTGNGTACYLPGMHFGNDSRTEVLINALSGMNLPTRPRIHEPGCNVGRNLLAARSVWSDATLTGNDINAHATTLATGFLGPGAVWLGDTVAWAKEAASRGMRYDAVITMAHLVHLPPDSVRELATILPTITSALACYELGCLEPGSLPQTSDDGISYNRSYTDLFGVPVVDRQDVEMRLYIWKFGEAT